MGRAHRGRASTQCHSSGTPECSRPLLMRPAGGTRDFRDAMRDVRHGVVRYTQARAGARDLREIGGDCAVLLEAVLLRSGLCVASQRLYPFVPTLC